MSWQLFEWKGKNLGQLWLAYAELQGDFPCYNSHMLTLGTLPLVIGKDHGHLLIKSAQHSYASHQLLFFEANKYLASLLV